MRNAAFVLAAFAFAAAPMPVQANEPVVLAPSSVWNVEFAADVCRLARVFGTGEDRHAVFFELYWPDDRTSLAVAGPAFRHLRSKHRTDLKFFEAQPALHTNPFTGTSSQFGSALIFSSISIDKGTDEQRSNDALQIELPQLDTELAGKVEFVSLRQRGDEIRLMTGPLGEAFKVLNRCALGLLTEWGLDEQKHLSATRMPRWINSNAVISEIAASYPRGAIEEGEQGIMRMRVIVGEDGTVEDCVMIKATETKTLESPACKAMRGALFEPALDSEGNPMRSFYAVSIIYQIA